jgi:hypothetical protein
MPTLEIDRANGHGASLYWLAFLLTGQREASIDITAESVESSEGNGFFSAWMLAWSRKVVIAKALAAIREELAASARRLESQRSRRCSSRPRRWALEPGATKAQIETALLAIDAFPRCALLLSIFEGLSIDDATVLLDGDRDLVQKAQVHAIQELTHNLANLQEAAYA